MNKFKKPTGTKGCFAVVKLWPDIKAAEDENIERLKITAKYLGLKCIVIDKNGIEIGGSTEKITFKSVDFVIHLHFETPKTYDAFSFVALWNPLKFYHDWGYQKFSKNLLTHDDFLSCKSRWADEHIERLIHGNNTHLPAKFNLFHSLSEPIFKPTLGECKLFYCGINWEKLGKSSGRHNHLLEYFDGTGKLKIYGPKLFQGVDVWKGFESYSGSVPFDGKTMVSRINECGVSLVLSSDAHKESELMSNRLFESLAAGVVIIADENPFAKKYFKDTILYIDTKNSPESITQQVEKHLLWIELNRDLALKKAKDAQSIFRSKFSLDVSLIDIYHNLNDRKDRLLKLNSPINNSDRVSIFAIIPTFDIEGLLSFSKYIKLQTFNNIAPVVLMDEIEFQQNQHKLKDFNIECEQIQCLKFFNRNESSKITGMKSIGSILLDEIEKIETEYFMFWTVNEEMFSGHISSLVAKLQKEQIASFAYSDILLTHKNLETSFYDLKDTYQIWPVSYNTPDGFSRFLFRNSNIDYLKHIRYMDWAFIALLLNRKDGVRTNKATMILDIQNLPYTNKYSAEKCLKVVYDLNPSLEKEERGLACECDNQILEPLSFSVGNLSLENKMAIAKDFLTCMPLPNFIKKLALRYARKKR